MLACSDKGLADFVQHICKFACVQGWAIEEVKNDCGVFFF